MQNRIGRRARVRRLARHLGLSTMLFTFGTLWVNAATGVEKLLTAWFTRSAFYAAVGAYYLILCGARYLLFRCAATTDDTWQSRVGTERFTQNDTAAFVKTVRSARLAGYALIVLTAAFFCFLVGMVCGGERFDYTGATVYAASAGAVYKIVFAAYNLHRTKKGSGILLVCIRQINYADALVSLVALQVSVFDLLRGVPHRAAQIASGLFGVAVCAAVIFLGVRTVHLASRTERAVNERRTKGILDRIKKRKP